MDGLTRLKHNVCGPGLCETRMHAYGRSLRALTEREATTHDHEREPVSLEPVEPPAGSRNAGTSLRASAQRCSCFFTVEIFLSQQQEVMYRYR